MTVKKVIDQKQYQILRNSIEMILEETKMQIQNSANNILAHSYWRIGKKINAENLTENSNYQKLTLQNLEEDLNITKSILSRTLKFYRTYPKGIKENLSWTHYRQLIAVKDTKSRASLTKKASIEGWTVRNLETNIKSLNDGANIKGELSPVAENGGKNGSKQTLKKVKRPTDPSYLYKAQIATVVDGDTLILNIDLGFDVIKKQRVRLTQIDAPEMKTEAGKKSHHYLRDLCARIEEVAVKTNKVDIYGRFLADIFYLEGEQKRGTTQNDIFTKGVYLNAKIVEGGFAEVF